MNLEQLNKAHKDLAKLLGKGWLTDMGGDNDSIHIGLFLSFARDHYDSITVPKDSKYYTHLYWSLAYQLINDGRLNIKEAEEIFKA